MRRVEYGVSGSIFSFLKSSMNDKQTGLYSASPVVPKSIFAITRQKERTKSREKAATIVSSWTIEEKLQAFKHSRTALNAISDSSPLSSTKTNTKTKTTRTHRVARIVPACSDDTTGGGNDDSPTTTTVETRLLVGKRFRSFGLNSSAHGVSNIFRVRSFVLRLLWIVCFLTSFGACAVIIGNLVASYLRFEVLVDQQVQNESPVDFPAVTVCNLNPFDHRRARAFISETLAAHNISVAALAVSHSNQATITPNAALRLVKSSMFYLNETARALLGFQLDDMLLTCFYNGVRCTARDFVRRSDFDYTNCYTFNSGYDQAGNAVPRRRMNEPGADRSLRLELFIGEDAADKQLTSTSGARVCIHNQSVTPILASEGIDIATGFQTNIGVTRRFLARLGPPYSSCIKAAPAAPPAASSSSSSPSSYYRAIFDALNITTYRQKMCLRLCLQDYIRAHCNCFDGSLPSTYHNNETHHLVSSIQKATDICASVSSIRCVSSRRKQFFSSAVLSACEQCPLECDTASFQFTTSVSRYPTNYYTRYLRSSHINISRKFGSISNDPSITKTTVLVNVFYDSLETTYTTELAAVTFESLIGNIGGNLGLFVGISVLTFVEIIELFMELCFICYQVSNR